MMSACLVLDFDGDIAIMVRWISGPHVNAHLDVTATLLNLKPIVDPDVYKDIARILTIGRITSPLQC